MKYQQPAGEPADAPYVDGNRAAGIRGSIPPAKAIEAPQRELAHLIVYAGLTPDAADNEQARKAVEALISAATGGSPAGYILMDQARARLPIFPEVLSADGKMNVTSPAAGTILVPSAVTFQHRGIFPVSTSDYDEATERTFSTTPNKTYHLRWNAIDGFSLKDVVDGAYNPTLLPETDAAFDSGYDDVLFARVVTDASNVAAVTNLVNRNVLRLRDYKSISFSRISSAGAVLVHPYTGGNAFALNWARTPNAVAFANRSAMSGGLSVIPDGPIPMLTGGQTDGTGTATASLTRYAVAPVLAFDMNQAGVSFTFASGVSVVADA